MNEAIQRASQPGATAAYVLKPIISSQLSTSSILLSDPTNSVLFFSALLSNPSFNNSGGITGLLLLVTPQFHNGKGTSMITVEQACNYLRAVALHVDCILDEWINGRISYRNVTDISKALGYAAYLCSQEKRFLISQSGILPALTNLIAGYQSHQQPKLTTATTAITPIHPDFLQIALLAGHYRFALSFLQKTNLLPNHPIQSILHLKQPTNAQQHDEQQNHHQPQPNAIQQKRLLKKKQNLHSELVLRYFYNLGLLHIGCDEFQEALSVFDVCCKVPCSNDVVSAIIISARKKMLLLRCLLLSMDDEDEDYSTSTSTNTRNPTLASKLMELPKGTSPSIIQFLQESERLPNTNNNNNNMATTNNGGEDSKAVVVESNERSGRGGLPLYHLLVSTYAEGHLQSLRSLLSKDDEMNVSEVLKRDGNLGLAKRMVPAIKHRMIRKLSRVYEAVSLTELDTKLDLDNEDWLFHLAFKKQQQTYNYYYNNSSWADKAFESSLDFSIDLQNSILYFYQDSDGDDDAVVKSDSKNPYNDDCNVIQSQLVNRITKCMQLAERVTQLDTDLVMSSRYQVKVMKEDSVKGRDNVVLDEGEGGATPNIVLAGGGGGDGGDEPDMVDL